MVSSTQSFFYALPYPGILAVPSVDIANHPAMIQTCRNRLNEWLRVDMPDESPRIYTTILQAAEPAPLPRWLNGIGSAPNAWRLVVEPDVLLATLQGTYSAEALRLAGVTVTNRQTQAIGLHSDLSTPPRTLVALCRPNGRPYDLVVQRGCLREPGPAVLAAYRDIHFRGALEANASIFITATIDDMIVLRSLSLAAITMSGLDRLAGENVNRFRKLMLNDTGAPYLPLWAHTVVLVGWSIARLDCAEPAGFDGTIGHLRRLNECLGLSLDYVQIWQPTNDQIEAFSFVLRCGRDNDRVDQLLRHVEKSSRWLIDRPEATLSSTFGELRRAEKYRLDTDLRHAQHQIKMLYQRLVNDPLIDAAAACSDVGARSLNLIAARLAEQVHLDQLQRLTHPTNKSLGLFHFYRDQKHLSATIQTIKLLLEIRKATKSCSTNPRMRSPNRMPDLFRQP